MTAITERLSAALAGRYRIERHLGEGGMASVYLCEDLKHERKVALKLLKPELAAVLGAERFVQEIKTTAALQHPHILPLFDSGTADGFLFYVMPYIQGETLREKLNRETQLGVDEAVRIAREVADALDYAHRHGVIHRDIKPENILLHDGRPMVADFGIALAVSAAAGGRMTETGLSLGTPHYMSPEQATAEKEITARSDVYSLGSVLYEMLTGNPPHTGASAQQIIMKIITEPAEAVTKFRKSVPPNVAAAVAKSLEKLPADRFESAKAFADALGNQGYTSASLTGSAAGAPASQRDFASWPLAVASLLAVTGFAGWTWSALRPAPTAAPHARFTIVVPDSDRIRPDLPGENFDMAPDGSAIVYSGGAVTDRLYIRALNSLDPRPIQGTEGARQAKFSPDGRSLAFVQGTQLRRIPVTGGPASTIADSATHFSWGEGDVIAFTRGGDLWRVGAGGGVPSIVARHDASGPQAFNWPFFLPGGKAVLFDIVSKSDQINAQLAAVRLSDGKVTPLGLTGRNPRYVTTGHIVFGRIGGTVAAVPFDASTLRVTGTAVTVLQGVFIRGGGATQIGVARNGTLFFVEGNPDVELSIMDQAGGTRSLGLAARNYNWPHFSPTSGRIVFQMADRGSFTKTDIWVYNDLTRTVSRLTNDGNSTYPFWMGDGERVVWITRDSAGTHVRRQRWDGTGTPETLFSGDSSIMYVVPAPSGSHWGVVRRGGFSDLYMAEGDPPSSPHALVTTREGEGGPRISPDGRWVAYYGDETGQTEVYVIAANGDGGRHQISIDGGGEPVWAPDGRTLYYRAGGNLVAAAITTSLAFSVTKREPMFADRFRSTGNIAEYDVSRDGRSFVVMGNVGRANERIVVVTGWLDELREQMAQAARK